MSDKLEVLFDEAAIASRVDELARKISRDYSDTEDLCLVAILKGAFIFLADLVRKLSVPHRVEFVAVSSYGDSSTSGDIRLLMDLRESVKGKHVLIVDDIIDSGATLAYLTSLLETRGAASVRSCILVRKAKERKSAVDPDYLGFEIPDVWVVGYGLDFADRHRTISCIAELVGVGKRD